MPEIVVRDPWDPESVRISRDALIEDLWSENLYLKKVLALQCKTPEDILSLLGYQKVEEEENLSELLDFPLPFHVWGIDHSDWKRKKSFHAPKIPEGWPKCPRKGLTQILVGIPDLNLYSLGLFDSAAPVPLDLSIRWSLIPLKPEGKDFAARTLQSGLLDSSESSKALRTCGLRVVAPFQGESFLLENQENQQFLAEPNRRFV